MTAAHWTGGNRRIFDLEKITHVMITEAGVSVFPMALTLTHTDGAELIWNWTTSPWKKIWLRVINSGDTEYLKDEYRTVYEILMEAIDR